MAWSLDSRCFAAMHSTHLSLLVRLQDTSDQEAWRDFALRYQPRLLAWCRHWGLQTNDAEDVAQTVLMQLAVKLKRFQYRPGGSFRGWLRTLTRHAWSEFIADRQRQAPARGGAGNDVLGTVEAFADLETRLAEVFDLEIAEAAMDRVRAKVEPHTWECFRLAALEGLSGAETAQRLSLPVATVFKAKSNVQKWLREQINLLEGGSAT